IGYMFGQYKRIRNEFTGVLTGKGLEWGGSLIRPEATGYGATYFAEEMLKTRGDSLKGKVVTVSGSGNVAQYATEKVTDMGGKVVTLSDSNGFIYDPDGIDAEKLAFVMNLKNVRRGRMSEYADKYKAASYHEGERPWSIKCDVAMPCATQNEVNEDEARLLIKNGCFVISEGANMPSTPEAVEVFLQAKILYGPGKAANAGGVSTSGLEMSQNSLRLSWTREEVDSRLHQIMKDIHQTCVKFGTQPDGTINYVIGANIGGFVKVADAMLAQGLV
ncbi:MAG: glutamate dehydrogenase, partial [Bacteroidales bacterium]|nr:glutamate dehydrogenase [Bacteroidales bacterium]